MRPAISVAGRGGALLPGGRRAPTASRHERRRGSVAAGAGVRFTGVGRAVPDTVISNDDLAQLIDTNDEWISTRTGIRARRVLGQGEKLADLASEASRAALEMAGVEAEELDLILFATSSADDMFGSASQVRGATCRHLSSGAARVDKGGCVVSTALRSLSICEAALPHTPPSACSSRCASVILRIQQ